jgi:hypothetical protein
MPSSLKGNCWNCGQTLSFADYGRENRCPGCQKATRCCRNCRFYAPDKANSCEEPLVENVVDKAAPNFCDFFEPTTHDGILPSASGDELLKAAEDLFK